MARRAAGQADDAPSPRPDAHDVANADADAQEPGRSTDRKILPLVLPLLEGQRRRLALLCVTSVLGGLVEAGLLVLVARAGFALASGKDSIHIDNSVLGAHTFTLWDMLGLAALLVPVRMALSW